VYGSAFAITSSGEAWAAGYSGYGQTGVGSSARSLWTKVNLPAPCVKVRSTSGGSYGHTLWLLSDGRVFAAGYNGYGQIGDGGSSGAVTGDPVPVTGLAGIVEIWAVGGQYGSSFASRADGAFFAWGRNNQGQLGLGDANPRPNATQNPVNNIVALAGSSYDDYTHTVALDSVGRAYAAGYNGYGQCGAGITGPVRAHALMTLPADVQGTITQVGITGYTNYTGSQLLDARGRVWACGYNGGCMLGVDNNLSYLTVAERVRF
jgi:alpha-tubulin suppressor-like RCC1 family protein